MMPLCPVASGSDDSEVTDLSLDSASRRDVQEPEDEKCAHQPEPSTERSEVVGGRSEGSHLMEDTERGDTPQTQEDDVPSMGNNPPLSPPHPPDSQQGQSQLSPPHPPDSQQGQFQLSPPHPPDSQQGQSQLSPPHPLDFQLSPPHPLDSQPGQCSCVCSQISQALDPHQPSSYLTFPPPWAAQTTVTPQPGVSQQIVLNFRERADGLALDGAPPGAVSQCPGEGSSQRGAKQIVLIFVNPRCDWAQQPCPGSCDSPSCTLNGGPHTSADKGCGVPPRSDAPPPPSVRSRSTQTEWDGRHRMLELTCFHTKRSPQRTASATQTDCPVPTCPLYYAPTTSPEEGAPGRAPYIHNPGQPTPSSDPGTSTEPCRVRAGTLTGSQVPVGTMTGCQVSAGTLTGCQGHTCEDLSTPPSLTGCQVSAGTLTGSQVSAGTLTGSQVSAGTLTGTQVSAGTLTGTQVSAGTLTGSQGHRTATCEDLGTPPSLTSSQVPAGTLTGNQVSAGTLTGSQGHRTATCEDLGTPPSLTSNQVPVGTLTGSQGHRTLTGSQGHRTATCEDLSTPPSLTSSQASAGTLTGSQGQSTATCEDLGTPPSLTGSQGHRTLTGSQGYRTAICEDLGTPPSLLDLPHHFLGSHPSSCLTKVPDESGDLVVSPSDMSAPSSMSEEPMDTVTSDGQDDLNPHLVDASSHPQTDQSGKSVCASGGESLEYPDNLQHGVSVSDPLHHPSSSSSSPPRTPSHIRKVILNFMEKDIRPEDMDPSSVSISGAASPSLPSMEGDEKISFSGTRKSLSSPGTPPIVTIPGDGDLSTSGDSEASLSSTLKDAGDQDVRTDSCDPLSSKPLAQEIPGCDSAGDGRSSSITDRSIDNSPSVLLNEAAGQDVPELSDFVHNASAPDTSSTSSSALMKDQSVQQEVPGPRDSPSTVLTQQSECLLTSNSAGESGTSRTDTRDLSALPTANDLPASEASVLEIIPVTPDTSADDPDSMRSSSWAQGASSSDTESSCVRSTPGSMDEPSSMRSHDQEPQSVDEAPEEMKETSVVRPESPKSVVRPESPKSVVRPESPKSVVRPESPKSVVRPESPKSMVRPESPMSGERPESPKSKENPKSVVRPESPKSKESLKSVVRPESPKSVVRLESPKSRESAKSEDMTERPKSGDRPERPKFRDSPESPHCQPQRPPKSYSCPPLALDGVMSSVSQVTFDDIAVYFTKEEWEVLEGPQKGLYCQVMMDNYSSLSSLGFLLDKPGLISRIEDGEAELWEDHCALGEDLPPLPALDPASVRSLDMDKETSGKGRESSKGSSHLGALMRLVNEIPGFLLGGSSPGRTMEDTENIQPCSEVKMEESSPSFTPASVHTPRTLETPESSSPGALWCVEKSNPSGSAKVEEVEIPIHPHCRQSQRARPPHPLHPPHIKSEPVACTGVSPLRELQIKQEELHSASGVPGKQGDVPSMKVRSSLIQKTPGSWEYPPMDGGRPPGSRGGGNPRTSLPLPATPRNRSASPTSVSDGVSSPALKDLHIKIKQEDSGSERDPAESPVCGRRVPGSPMAPSPGMLEHLRMGGSPRRPTMDRRSPHTQESQHGISHLHGLVNCLREISASRPWATPPTPPTGRCGTEADRSAADPSLAAKRAALDPSSPSRVFSILWRPPDEISKDETSTTACGSRSPFTVPVTNGSGWPKGADTKTRESSRLRGAETPSGGTPTSGKCPERVHTRSSRRHMVSSSGIQKTEEPRRAELGVKRTRSDDPPRPSGATSAAKRPTLDSSPSRVVDGNCPLMSVRNCVRKIPSCWAPPPSARGPATGSTVPEPRHIVTQGGMSGRILEVKEEESPSPIPTPTKQWMPPPGSPRSPEQPGKSTNVHLSGLMRLMEEIPVAESSSSSRTMYNIAIGHSMMRRLDRTNFLSYFHDDSSFQAELNENTVASVDSVYSDDTSLSSENLDPSYSAIGGLQRVVSEFAEIGSVSPLVAVSVPQTSSGQEAHGPKSRDAAPAPRLNDGVRGVQRGTPGGTASVCSTEDGVAAYAALCGLQKVVHGFNEQECVSPFSAVQSAPHHGGPRDSLSRRSFNQEEEEESLRLPDSSPGPAAAARFLCDASPKADSSYSALSGLQKVVNGFSDLGCVSPFSAVSTSTSESAVESCSRRAPALDVSWSALSGMKKVVNGVPDSSCASPATASSDPPSVGEPDPGAQRRCEQAEVHTGCLRSRGPSIASQRDPLRSGGHCIDLTQEEEPKSRAPNQERQSTGMDLPGGRAVPSSSGQTGKAAGRRSRPPASSQLIDLTEEEETPARPRGPSAEAARRTHSASPHKANADRKHRTPVPGVRTQRAGAERPLDPGPSGAHRGGIPTVNEHISGLEKLLKGVPTFTPPHAPSGQRRTGSWWFKSTSPHET